MSIHSPKTKLGYAEYCLFPDDRHRHEIIDGRHYRSPAPNPSHQSVSKHLQYVLYTQIELTGLGKVFNAPIDVQLGEHDIVQPDLIVILKKSSAMITKTRVKGPPDLVVEILSKSTQRNDQELKRGLYEQSMVPEYWIADPVEQKVVQLAMKNGVFHPLKVGASNLKMSILPSVIIPLTEIWRHP